MLIVTAIDSIRNLPSAALFGSSSACIFLLAGIVFLIPTALVAAELTALFREKGGVYHWVDRAFGNKWAMAAIWMQWINTMVWYPTILSFIAGTAAYIWNPVMAENKSYLIATGLVIFWGLTFLNSFGLHVSSKINTVLGIGGTIFPMLLLMVAGGIWIFSGNPVQITGDVGSWIPSFSDMGNLVALIAVMASFLGMELSGVHVSDIENPQKNFPKAVLLSCICILTTMILGSLAIAVVLPSSEINLIAGVMQVLSRFFSYFGISRATPILASLIVAGSIGGIINWLISPAKGLLHAAEFGYLPRFFSRKTRNGVPVRILLTQAVVVSIFCFVYLFIPGVNAFYWFLTALSTELYMIMYVLMFAAAWKLRRSHPDRPPVFKIPGKSIGIGIVCLLGCSGCFATIGVSFLPPESIDIGSKARYIGMIVAANVLTISPLFLFYCHKKRGRSQSV